MDISDHFEKEVLVAIITISREAGSFGDELAERIANKTGYTLIDFDGMIDLFLKPIANEHEQQMLEVSARHFFEPVSNNQKINFKSYLEDSVLEWAKNNNAILLGCAGNYILSNHPRAIHLKIIADEDTRLERIRLAQGQYKNYLKYKSLDKTFETSIDSLRELKFMEKFISSQEILGLNPLDLLQRIDRQYRRFITTVFQADDNLLDSFHLICNTGKTSLDACLNLICSLIDDYKIQKHLEKQGQNQRVHLQNHDLPDFANESETEFAKLLNLYQIDWRYEPKFFPVEWDEENRVTMAFSPDFYLPKFDLYLELTTMNQRYVSAKRKKLKKLQELYPGINVKIIYRRDFLSLIQRFEN